MPVLMYYDRLPNADPLPAADPVLAGEAHDPLIAAQADATMFAQRQPPSGEQVLAGESVADDPMVALLDRVQATGDIEALWMVANGLRPALVNTAKSFIRRYSGWLRTDEEDIVSDVIIKVVSRFQRASGSDQGAFPRPGYGYFVATMRSVIADLAKKRSTRVEYVRGGLVVATEEDGAQDLDSLMLFDESPEDVYLRRERQRQAAAAAGSIMSGITPKQRAAIDYGVTAVEDPEEAATLFDRLATDYGWTKDTLKVSAHRARQAARRMLNRGEVSLPE